MDDLTDSESEHGEFKNDKLTNSPLGKEIEPEVIAIWNLKKPMKNQTSQIINIEKIMRENLIGNQILYLSLKIGIVDLIVI